KVARPENAAALVAGHLMDLQAYLSRPDVHQRFNLKARAVDLQRVQVTSPERVVPVAQVGELSPEHAVDEEVQQPVPAAAHAGDVIAAAAAGKPRALREISAGHERADELDDLRPVGGAVRVDRHDDVAGSRREPGQQRVSLPPA